MICCLFFKYLVSKTNSKTLVSEGLTNYDYEQFFMLSIEPSFWRASLAASPLPRACTALTKSKKGDCLQSYNKQPFKWNGWSIQKLTLLLNQLLIMDHYQIRRISIGPKLWWPPNQHHWAVVLCILRDTVCSSENFVNFHEYDPWATKIELARSCWHAFSREFGSLWLISR